MNEKKTGSEKRPGFDEMLAKLEKTVAKLENENTPLEESLALYEQGIGLLKECLARLKEAEGRVEMLVRDSEGVLKEVNFTARDVPASQRPGAVDGDEDDEKSGKDAENA